EASGSVKGKLARRRKVFPAKFGWIDTQLSCDEIEGAIDDIRSCWPACATIGVGSHLVGEARGDVHLDCGNLVRAGEHQASKRRDGRSQQLMIGTEVRKHTVTQSIYCSVVLERNLDVANLSASVNCRLNVFSTRFDPLHGFAELHRDPTDECFLTVNIQLGAKAAADFRSDHAQLVFRNANHDRELSAQQMRNLR